MQISDTLAETLDADREMFNAMFVEFRMSGHEIDPAIFLSHIARAIDPVTVRIADVLPERTRVAVRELYRISLSLFASSLLGSNARIHEIPEMFERLFPAIPAHIARDPSRVVASLCNAVYNLASQNGARAKEWMDRLIQIAPACEDANALLDCGKLLAWQSGMAQYRDDAIATARKMPTELATRLLTPSSDLSRERLDALLDRLQRDPWAKSETDTETVSSSGTNSGSIHCVRTLGAFRGFGGDFLSPPTVCCSETGLHVTDGKAHWDLIADAYGTFLHRCHPRKPRRPADRSPTIFADGKVSWDDRSAFFPELAKSSSRAFDGTTLAVTLPTSHQIYLLACT